MITQEINHNEEFSLDLLCIFELEKFLLQLKLDSTICKLLVSLLSLNFFQLIQMATQARIKFGVNFGLANRVSQVTLCKLDLVFLSLLFFELTCLAFFG